MKGFDMVKVTESPSLTEPITFQVSPVMLKTLKQAAQDEDRSLSSFIRVALSECIARRKAD